tara:strand:+ start:938 stop:1423 length:486 start_codon:yes stop_codon:yes gene_type:complete
MKYKTDEGKVYNTVKEMVKAHWRGEINLKSNLDCDDIEVSSREIWVTLNYGFWTVQAPLHLMEPDITWPEYVFWDDFSCKYGRLVHEPSNFEMDLNCFYSEHVDFEPPESVDVKWPDSLHVDDYTTWVPCELETLLDELYDIGVEWDEESDDFLKTDLYSN